MSFRFRRTITLVPGVALTASKSGLNVAVGGKFGRVGVGPRGAYVTISLPGTGLSYRKSLARGKATKVADQAKPISDATYGMSPEDLARALGEVRIEFTADGDVVWTDVSGEPLPWDVTEWIMTSQWDRWSKILSERVLSMNAVLRQIESPHLDTPIHGPATFRPRVFETVPPERVELPDETWADRTLPWKRRARHKALVQTNSDFDNALSAYREALSAHASCEIERQRDFDRAQRGDVAAIFAVLEESLQSLAWPRQTFVHCCISNDGSEVCLDVDLPELEHMPGTVAIASATGHRVRLVPLPHAERKALYMSHVLGIIFRLHGEVFAVSERIAKVVISGYTQRKHRQTGALGDEYIVSAEVARESWKSIGAEELQALDLKAWFKSVSGRADCTPSGHFRAIEPLERALMHRH